MVLATRLAILGSLLQRTNRVNIGAMKKNRVIFDGGDFLIRDFIRDDAESFALSGNDREVWLCLRDRFPSPYTRRDALDWIDLVNNSNPKINFAIDVEGRVAGGIGLMLQTDVARVSAEIGYWLGKEYWGKGIMTKAVSGMSEWAFCNLPITRLYALVFDFNKSSARVLEKCGYQLEGRLRKAAIKDGKVVDELLYAKIRDELSTEAKPQS